MCGGGGGRRGLGEELLAKVRRRRGTGHVNESLAKIRGYPARLNRVVVLLFKTLITKHSFIVEKQEKMFRARSSLKALCHSSPLTITFLLRYCCIRTTNIDCTMTIFRKCNNLLNN